MPDGHFDLCFSMQVLECAPTAAVVRAYAAEAHRVLKGGALYLLLSRDRMWLLESYPGMTRHLDHRSQRIAQSKDFVLFGLA